MTRPFLCTKETYNESLLGVCDSDVRNTSTDVYYVHPLLKYSRMDMQ